MIVRKRTMMKHHLPFELLSDTLLNNQMSGTDQTGSGDRLKIEFWGVRGSSPAPQSDKVATGGNTPCTVLQYGSEPLVIIDGGTGLRSLGLNLQYGERNVLQASILFSHFHWDHIQGLPFFGPIHSKILAARSDQTGPWTSL